MLLAALIAIIINKQKRKIKKINKEGRLTASYYIVRFNSEIEKQFSYKLGIFC